jgi:transposase
MNDSNTFEFSSNAVFWGVDVAAAKLDLGRHDQSQVVSFDNSPEGIALLVAEVERHPLALVVVEATGGYETPLLTALAEASLPVVRINPRQLRSFAVAVGQLAKTDAIDAALIARFAHQVRPAVRPLASPAQRRLADLAARRRQLLSLRTAELNRRRKTERPELLESIEAVVAVLNEQLEQQLAQLVQTDPAWRERDQLLQSVPGIAATTSRTLLADLPELGQLPSKQLAKLVGIAPLNRDSGKLRGRRTIFAGRRTIRTALYMAAFSATRWNPSIRTFYQRLRQAGKPFKVALTACMRKLLAIINAILRDNKPWRNTALTP